MVVRIAAALTLLVGLADVSAAPPISVTVHFDGRTVTASGFSPGTEVLFLGDAKIPLTYYSRLKQWQFVVTASRYGTASVQTEIDIPINAVWVIADLRTGEITLATPRPLGVQTVDIGRSALRTAADRFTFDRSFLDLLYVHAGEGAWLWHATDGGVGDQDGPNGLTTIDVAKAVRIAGLAPLKVFSPGGTLVAIDFIEMKVLTTHVQTLLSRNGQ